MWADKTTFRWIKGIGINRSTREFKGQGNCQDDYFDLGRARGGKTFVFNVSRAIGIFL